MKAKSDHIERYVARLANELRVATGEERPRTTFNVRWVSYLFDSPDPTGPPPPRYVMAATKRGTPVSMLIAAGLRPHDVAQSAN